MAKKYRTGIIIEGDSKGGVRAIKATESQLGKLERQNRRNTRAARALASAYGGLRVTARHIGAAAGVAGAGLAALAVSQTDAFRQTQALSQTLGVSVGQLQAYQYAAEQVGVSGEKMADILKDTADKIGDAYANQGGEAYQVLQNLNLSAANLVKLSPDQQLVKIAQALEDMPKAVQINALESLGDDASRLLPLLQDGAQGLHDATREAYRFNAALDQTDASKMAEASDQMSQLRGVAKGLAQEITIGAAPAISELTDTLTDPDVQRGLTTFVQGFVKATHWVVEATAAFANFTASIGEHAREMTQSADDILASPIAKAQKRIDELQNQLKATQQLGMSGGVIGAPNAGLARSPDDIKKELAEQKKILADYRKQKAYFDQLYSGQNQPSITRYQVARPHRIKTPTGSPGPVPETSPADRETAWQADRIGRSADIFQGALGRLESDQQSQLDQVRQALMKPEERRNNTLNQRLGTLQTAKDRGLITEQERLKETGRAWDAYARAADQATGEVSEFATQAAYNIEDTLGTTLQQTLGGHFDGIGKMWLDTLNSMAANAASAGINDALFGKGFGKTGDIGGLLGKGLGAFTGQTEGGFLSDAGSLLGKVPFFADGGISDKPSIFGESGPEAAVPLPDGRRIPVDLRGQSNSGGSSSPTFNVTYNEAPGKTQDERDNDRGQFMAELKQIAKQATEQHIGEMVGDGSFDKFMSPYTTQRAGHI